MAELFDCFGGGHVLRTFVQYLMAVCSRTEAASDNLLGQFGRPIVPDKFVKFPDPRFSHSREIPSEAAGAAFWLLFCNNLLPEAFSDVISGVAVE